MNSQVNKPAINVNKISWLYLIAITCQMLGNSVINSFVSFYVTDRMLISATIMASILAVSRIADLVVGTLAGIVVQKTQFRFGQYRSWLLYGPLLVSCGSTLCFINPNIPIGIKMVFVAVGYLGYGVGMSFVQLGQNGLIPRIAGTDSSARVKISSRITIGQNAARLISGAVLAPLVLFFDGLGADGYTVVQILFAVIALIGQAFLFFGLREVDKYDPDFKASNTGNQVSIIKILTTAVKNVQMLILLVSDILRFTVMQTIGALGAYYFTYVAGNFAMLSVSMTAQGFASLAGAILCPYVSRKIGKKNSATLSGVLMTLAMFYLGFLSDGQAVAFIIANCVTQFSFCFLACNGPNLYIDAGEYQYAKTGVDNRTFSTSVFGIATKFSWIFVGYLTAIVLNGSGYDQVAKTVANTDMMCKLIGGVPCVMFLIFTLLMTFVYRLDEKKVKEAYEINAKRDAETHGI